MTCRHGNAEHLMPGELVSTTDGIVFLGPVLVEQFRCIDCRAYLSLGPSNDEPWCVRVEIELAGFLAETNCLHEPGLIRGDYEGGLIDGTLERLGPYQPPRPRSPIEMMVDRACGLP